MLPRRRRRPRRERVARLEQVRLLSLVGEVQRRSGRLVERGRQEFLAVDDLFVRQLPWQSRYLAVSKGCGGRTDDDGQLQRAPCQPDVVYP